jgi:hypothetical protein
MSGPSVPDLIRKTIVVRCDLDTAFRTWTERIDVWWPKGHSRSGDPRATIVLERRAGGRLYERTPEGTEYAWGQVLAWDPPHYFAWHWYLGSSAERPTRVEVHFSAQGSGDTQVDLLHHGPELIGEQWGRTSIIFDTAWEHVLAAYQAECAPNAPEQEAP